MVFNDSFVYTEIQFTLSRACLVRLRSAWNWWQDPAYLSSVLGMEAVVYSEAGSLDLVGGSFKKLCVYLSDTVYNTTGMVIAGPRSDAAEMILPPGSYGMYLPDNYWSEQSAFWPHVNRSHGSIKAEMIFFELPQASTGQYPDGEESKPLDEPEARAVDEYLLVEGVKKR